MKRRAVTNGLQHPQARGELRPVSGVEGEMATARQAARSTFKKHGKGDRKHEHDAHHD